MKYIQFFENYRFFNKKNIGDIVVCYSTPSYGIHYLQRGKKYEIVDTRYNDPFYEIKVKPIEYEKLPRGNEYDRYYLEAYFIPSEEKLKQIRDINKYNIWNI